MSVDIRRIESNDTSTLQMLIQQAILQSPNSFGVTAQEVMHRDRKEFANECAVLSKSNDHTRFIAYIDCQPVGFIGVREVSGELKIGYIYELWVHPDHRRRSVAKELLKSSFVFLNSLGTNICTAWLMPSSNENKLFFKNTGFFPTDYFQPTPSKPEFKEQLWINPCATHRS